MKRYQWILLIVAIVIGAWVFLPKSKLNVCRIVPAPKPLQAAQLMKPAVDSDTTLRDALIQLKSRKDKEAMALFDKVLAGNPANADALWGKAEVLRRSYDFTDSEAILIKVFEVNKKHLSSLITLSYIRYKQEKLNDARDLVMKVLADDKLDRENEAMAYMMLGAINGRRAEKSWLFGKVAYGTQIECYFLKAKEIAPDLPEVRLGLGAFYLKAPGFVGGDVDKAIEEFVAATKMTPEFATPYARLAQAYKKKGNMKLCNFYKAKTIELDPENEVIKEEKL